MGFTKNDLRSILKENGVEAPTKELLESICDLHIDSQNDCVEKEVAKAIAEEKKKSLPVKESEEYKELEKKYQKTLEGGGSENTLDVKETEEYKALESEIEKLKNIASEQKLSAYKKSQLEKLGIKGSALDLIVKADFDFEFEEDGKVKEESEKKYTDLIKETYADLIPKEKGKNGANPKGDGDNGGETDPFLDGFGL